MLVAEGVRSIVVTGVPGVGNSYFGLYVLWQLAMRGETVIWQRSLHSERYKFQGSTVQVGGLDSFRAELRNPSTWHELPPYSNKAPLPCPFHFALHASIRSADVLLPTGVRRFLIDEPVASNPCADFDAVTIMFSSPKRDNYKALLNATSSVRQSDILYMPAWSEEELLECQRLIFNNVTPARVKELYSIWGGVPRMVFDNAVRSASSLATLRGLLGQASLSSLLAAAGGMDMADTHSHRLLQWLPQKTLSSRA
jgi:hypothetical protein